MRYPLLSGLCLIAKETEQGVTFTLFIIFDNVTKYKEQSNYSINDSLVFPINRQVQSDSLSVLFISMFR